MASKCPKCDKTVYFGEYPPAVRLRLQAPGREPHPVMYTDGVRSHDLGMRDP